MAGAVGARAPALIAVRAPAVLLVAALLLFTLALGSGSLWDQDEAQYTEVARQIVERGDALTLYVNGEPWFVHPPLYMWLQALTGRLFGFTEWTARIWTALFGAAGVLVTYLLGRRLYDARTGVLAGLVLMTTLEWFALSRLAIFDVVLVTFMLLALYMVLVAQDAEGPVRRRAYRWAFVWAGLGTLTKGPIALLLPGMALGAWWLLRRRWRVWRELPWEGVALYAAIGLSWYAAQAVLHGGAFVRTALGYYTLNRFFGVVENQPGPWYYYAPVLVVGAFPWTAFLPSAAVFLWRRRRDARSLLLLLWPGLTLLFYSLAGTKLPNYILPVYPIAAIGLAHLWTTALWAKNEAGGPEARRLLGWGFALVFVTLALLAVAVTLFGRWQYPTVLDDLGAALRLLGTVLAVGLAAGVALYAARRRLAAFAALPLTAALVFVLLVTNTLPRVEALRPMKPVAQRIAAALAPGDRIVGVGISERASLIYYSRHDVIWTWGRDDTVAAVCRPGRAFVVAAQAAYDAWLRQALPGLTLLERRGDVVLLEKPRPCPEGTDAR